MTAAEKRTRIHVAGVGEFSDVDLPGVGDGVPLAFCSVSTVLSGFTPHPAGSAWLLPPVASGVGAFDQERLFDRERLLRFLPITN